MVKKKLSKGKLALIILSSCALLWGATFSTDAILANYEKRPIFAIKYPDIEGATNETYIGLLYTIYVFDYPTGCPLYDPDCPEGRIVTVEVHSWFYRG